MLEKAEISGDAAQLKKSLIPWEERDNIAGRKASRVFEKDSLALKQDFVGKGPQWRVLGPFRLISVGERIQGVNQDGFSDGVSGNTITIAAAVDTIESKEVFKPEVQELLEVLYSTGESKNSVGKIVALQLYPADSESKGAPLSATGEPQKMGTRLPLDKDERAIIVPLKDVESIPELLVRGTRVGFVVKL